MLSISPEAESLISITKRITSVNLAELLYNNPNANSGLSFEAVFKEMKIVQDIFRPLEISDVAEAIPNRYLTELTSRMQSFLGWVKQIETFYRENSSDEKRRHDIVQKIREDSHEILERISSLYGTSSAVGHFTNQFTSEKITELLEVAEKSQRALRDAEEASIVWRDLLTNKGLSLHADIFEEAADLTSRKAQIWLIATALITFSVIAILLFFFFNEYRPPSGSGAVASIFHAALEKAVIVVVLISAAVWAGRNYRVLKHIEDNNRAKSRALRTADAFIKASDTSEVKNQVLIETTRAIFSITPSGYVPPGTDSSVSTPTTMLQQVLRDSSGKS